MASHSGASVFMLVILTWFKKCKGPKMCTVQLSPLVLSPNLLEDNRTEDKRVSVFSPFYTNDAIALECFVHRNLFFKVE